MKYPLLFIFALIGFEYIAAQTITHELDLPPVEQGIVYYKLGISYINAGTGHNSGFVISGNVKKNRKSLKVGLIISSHELRVMGGDYNFRYRPWEPHYFKNSQMQYQSYLQYNVMFQKSLSFSPIIIELGGKNYQIESEPGMITTIGNYLGFGENIDFSHHFLLDTSLGIGIYHGSLDKINGPQTLGFHFENWGITYCLKIGIEYLIN
jgi:hypothetical protein